MTETRSILLRAGLIANINTTATKNAGRQGEPHYATDSQGLYVHNGTKNIRVTQQRGIAKTADYTMVEYDDVVLVDTTAGAVTIILPSAADGKWQEYVIKKTAGGNTLTLDGAGGETIDGAATQPITTWMRVWSDGTAWYIVG